MTKPTEADVKHPCTEFFVSHGNVHDEFAFKDEVNKIFASIGDIYKDQIAFESAYERCIVIFGEYQEQPHLLDPHLESMIGQLIDIVKAESSPQEVIDIAFKFMYIITKTRGHKVIVRFLPHEVADLEPLLAMLAKQSPEEFKTWETRYMLLVWLSIACMIPFDMVRLDSNQRTESGDMRKPITDRILEAGKTYIEVSDKTRDAAAYMLAKFLTRPDVRKHKLGEFLDWAFTRAHAIPRDSTRGQTKLISILSSLAYLFKLGKREDLVDYATTLLEQVTKLKLAESNNSFLRKLGVKIVQRIALTFLKSKVASWRYQRGSRSLVENLTAKSILIQNEPTGMDEDDEEEYDIPDEMEDVIEQLLHGLRDSATIVRWSAAKGIGRVTGRLPKELADEVVGSLMELFTIAETDVTWHGACLALAELGRRGLLLPQRLPDVVPVILRALAYDEKRGNFSVGSHVRDAACYVCWSFARAYDPDDIKPYITQIASALIVVAVFDREINIRRAAAAAFQENVGRQGQFPHGIDIVVTVDFFAVGNRQNAYLELSVFLAQYVEYTHALIDHLYKVKFSHWDIETRIMAAKAMERLTEKDPTYVAKTVLPVMVEECTSIDLSNRHGAVIMSGHVVHALSKIAEKQNKNVTELIGEKTTNILKTLAQTYYTAQLFRGGGGEMMRKAICCLIEKLSLSNMPFHNDPVIEVWQELIDECLAYNEPEVQKAGVGPITAFFFCYYQDKDGRPIKEIQEKILAKYLRELESPVENNRMGFALAIGAMPKFMFRGRLSEVIADLANNSRINPKYVKYAEARRDATLALGSICSTVGVDKAGSPNDVICPPNMPVLYDAFFEGTQDYTLDNRGDVGSWVREASIVGLQTLTSLLVKHDPALVDADRVRKLFCCVLQQASEKIDRTRDLAGLVLVDLLHHTPEVPHIPHREELSRIFRREMTQLNLAVPSVTFPLVVQLLGLPTYAYSALLGITVSVGGLTESIVKHSRSSLSGWLRMNIKDLASCERFCGLILQLCADYPKKDRVMLPMMKMLDQLIAEGSFGPLYDAPETTFPSELLRICKREAERCGDPQKLLAIIDVCCGLLSFTGDVRTKTLLQLLIFLCHKYPIVRKQGAQKLYEAFITYDDIVDDTKLDDVTNILSDTQWNESQEKIRPIRNQLCDVLGVPQPKLKAQPKSQ